MYFFINGDQSFLMEDILNDFYLLLHAVKIELKKLVYNDLFNQIKLDKLIKIIDKTSIKRRQ